MVALPDTDARHLRRFLAEIEPLLRELAVHEWWRAEAHRHVRDQVMAGYHSDRRRRALDLASDVEHLHDAIDQRIRRTALHSARRPNSHRRQTPI